MGYDDMILVCILLSFQKADHTATFFCFNSGSNDGPSKFTERMPLSLLSISTSL